MTDPFILAIDQGTSSTKTVILDAQAAFVAGATKPLKSSFPHAGFVEQDPQEIYASALDSVQECVQDFVSKGGKLEQIRTCGISNQRETFILWNKGGEPLTNAIVWQCKRSVGLCNRLKQSGIEQEIKNRTGLIIDPYFSGTKVIWLKENHADIARAIESRDAYFGTVDTWLLYRLTKGSQYLTDHTNASRTLFFNIHSLEWDRFLIQQFGCEGLNLPEVLTSANHFGETDFDGLLPNTIPINSMIGDSHAAAFGEGCFHPGIAKATLGTGSSILMNVGHAPRPSKSGMMSTICWSIPDRVDYASEGVIVSAGATIQWMRDQLELFADSAETEAMARQVRDNNGVYVIPAFSGLGAPHWKMDARGAIVGLTFGATKHHVARAALESIPYQIRDVISAMEQDIGVPLQALRVDGGITSNTFVMQFLTNVLGCPVVNIGVPDVSALGAGLTAGIGAGIYSSLDQIESLFQSKIEYQPDADHEGVQNYYREWQVQVARMIQ
ncbi:glycerol kinase GlpK [candidate division KSB1 bacterium]|nr:glycerol kinase GlpK [candidate division KSB1 bacterium]